MVGTTGTPESSIFKAVSEKVQKQGMYCRRRIFRPRFTFELRPLLEHFLASRCQHHLLFDTNNAL